MVKSPFERIYGSKCHRVHFWVDRRMFALEDNYCEKYRKGSKHCVDELDDLFYKAKKERYQMEKVWEFAFDKVTRSFSTRIRFFALDFDVTYEKCRRNTKSCCEELDELDGECENYEL